jgi:hypothetical protein
MDHARSRWFVVGSMVVASVASILVGIIALVSLSGHGVRDIPDRPIAEPAIATVSLGTLLPLAVDMATSPRRPIGLAVIPRAPVQPTTGQDRSPRYARREYRQDPR